MVSPCAYVVGLLGNVVIDELDLRRHGYRVTPADPNLWCPVRGRDVARGVHRRRRHRGPHARERVLGRRRARGARLRGPHRPHPPAAARGAARGHLVRPLAQPRSDRRGARRRRDGIGGLRGVDRRDAGALRRRPAPARRARRAGRHRRLGGPARPGDRGGEADALDGRPRGARLGVGLRRGRDGQGLVRDRRRRAGGGRRARRGRPGRADRPRRGRRAGERRDDPGAPRRLQRRPQARARDARRPGRAGRLPRPPRGMGRALAGREAQRRAHPAAGVHVRPRASTPIARWSRSRAGWTRCRPRSRRASAASPRSASRSCTSRPPTTPASLPRGAT